MSFADVDWRWFLAAGVLAVLGRVHHMGKEIDELKKDLKETREDLDLFKTTPWPSDGTEEANEIKVAKELAKRMGGNLMVDDALKIITKVQKARKEIDEAKGAESGERS